MAKKSSQVIPPFVIGEQIKGHEWGGINTAVKDNRFLLRGESYDQVNWLTGRNKDYIELRRGSALLGKTRHDSPNAKATGVGVGILNNGKQVPFFTYKRKLLYYDATIDDTVEVNTVDLLPEAASGENVNFFGYGNIAGSFVYLTSPNSSFYKIAVANPADPVDEQIQTHRFAFARTYQSRMFAVGRKGNLSNSFDKSGVYLSWTDRQTLGDYPAATLSPSLFTGDGTTKIFSGTLAVPPINTIFYVNIFAPISAGVAISGISQATNAVIDTSTPHGLNVGDAITLNGVGGMTQMNNILTTVYQVLSPTQFSVPIDSTVYTPYTSGGNVYAVEAFNDDQNGNLNSQFGGTGTINYATGDYSVTFDTAPITGQNGYGYFNTENATNEGILDFSFNATNRVPFTGEILRQDDGGGNAMAVFPFNGVEYCFHILKSWQLTLSTDDTTFNNLPYFEQIGIPSHRAAFPTGEGIIFLDNSNPGNPTVSILQIPEGATNLTVVPIKLSLDYLDLSKFGYDEAVMWRWGDFDILSCSQRLNGVMQSYNQVTFIRNVNSGLWNKLDYYINCLAEYNGTLISGDSLSPNLFTLFSGFDDDGAVISNYHKQAYTDLDIVGLKTVGYLNMSGLIQKSQKMEVWYSLDQGEYVYAYTISGQGSYVSSKTVTVGTVTVGSNVIGGGMGTQEVTALQWEFDIPLHTDKFEYISFMVKAIDVGFIRVERAEYKDIRWKRRRILPSEDQEIDN